MVSGYPTSTSIPRVDGLSTDPRFWSITGNERDEDLDNEVVDQPPSESLAPQATDTPNQSLAEDGLAVVFEPPRKQLRPRQTRGIPKPTYEPKLFSKVNIP